MQLERNRQMGQLITRLLQRKDLTREEAYGAFAMILNNEVTEMQQGGFLAALTCKGETAAEVAGGWQAVYDLDTRKVTLNGLSVVDNCGTGMDSFKTFNISTAASIVAAGGGVRIARHGARAITSACGTVDLVERLGIDVECPVTTVAESIAQAGIGLFNGMSPEVHPLALGRILSQICFGSPLNIAASLAHPALPKKAVRGVYSRALVRPVAEVMREIGYTDALVIHGAINGSQDGMDEASVCGTTHMARLQDGRIEEFTVEPEEVGIDRHPPQPLAADPDRDTAARRMIGLLAGQGDRARLDAVALNCGLIFLVDGRSTTLAEAVARAKELLHQGVGLGVLRRWTEVQNRDPRQGLQRLAELEGELGRC